SDCSSYISCLVFYYLVIPSRVHLSPSSFIITAQDCPKPVPGPNMNLKDSDIVLQEFPDGTKVTFTCEVGYQSGGSGVSTCSAGNWSLVMLQCKRKNCGALEAVINGDITYPTSTLFGDTAVVTCNTGYRRVGRETIRCGDAGWLDRLPVCEVSKCGPPPAIADGTFYPEKEEYEYSEVVRYSCQKDLTLNGSKSVSCSEDGTFTPAAPTCINVQCEAPNIDNADFTSGSRYPYKYKATVTHQCRTGYMMIGQSTSVCEIDGQWSPKLLECKRKTNNNYFLISSTVWQIITFQMFKFGFYNLCIMAFFYSVQVQIFEERSPSPSTSFNLYIFIPS
uniref:Sushi domain-containing protein n=1 Tax=Labrus bergylta TaxID=56723 RepID=A0A3Q3FTM4_9LABR